jgi:hypothetical protein
MRAGQFESIQKVFGITGRFLATAKPEQASARPSF